MTDEELEERLRTANKDLLAASGSCEHLRQLLLRNGGGKGLESELSTNVRVIGAVRENIKHELKRIRDRIKDKNQGVFPFEAAS